MREPTPSQTSSARGEPWPADLRGRLTAAAGAAARFLARGNHYMLAVLAFLAVWLTLSAPWLSGRVTIPYDAKAHFQAQIQFLANAIHSGQSPFWLPHTFAGSPQIADPQSLIFSPAALLALFDAHPSFRAMDTYVLALLGLAGLAVMLFFKDRGWHPAGALVAAIALAFGASAAWRVQHIGQIKSFALIWIALALLSRALERRSLGYGVASGLAAGLMLAEPDQVALLGSYLLAGFIAAHWLAAPGRRAAIRASLRPLLAATITGALIVAVPLVLTMLFVSGSNRPAISFAEAVRGSLHPVSLLTMLVGDLFGAFDPAVEYWGPFSEAWDPNELTLAQNMSQMYLGALPFLLVLTLGLARGLVLAREVRLFAIATLLLLLYAVGHHTPVFRLFYELVPGVKLFRRPADATFLIGGTMAILGGYLVHRLLIDARGAQAAPEVTSDATADRNGGARRIAVYALPIAGLLASLLVAMLMRHLGDAWRPILVALGWIALSAATIQVLPRLSPAAPALAVLLPAVLLAADLADNNGPNESTALPPAQYAMLEPESSNETVALLKKLTHQRPGSARRDRVELTGLGFEWPNAAMVHGLDHLLGYNPLRLDLITQAVGATDTVAGPDQRHFSPLFPSYKSRLADLLGLRYIATSVPVQEIDHALQPGDLRFVTRTADAYVYENPRAYPRAMFAAEARQADFAAIMRSGVWPAFDPAETVLLDEAPPVRTGGLTRRLAAPLAPARVKIRSYENTRVEIEVDTATAGHIILNDIWHPWWTASVDGQPARIRKANVLFRAVAVPAGRHLVVFDFHPISGALEELAGKLSGDGQAVASAPATTPSASASEAGAPQSAAP